MKVNMKLFGVCSIVLLAAATAFAESHEMKAKADIRNASDEIIGTANLVQQKDGVKITLKVSGLPAGQHGFHIHETGKCLGPGFKSAGGHFNPYNKKHGSKNPKGKHAGDFPNLEVKQDGSSEFTTVVKGVTLGKGKGSLTDKGGTALVIHADPDDYKTDPAGNAGARLACGVIVKE